MKNNELNELRDLLLLYKVPEPGIELVLETKRIMREEMKEFADAPSFQAGWIVMLIGMGFVMALGLFYTFTVGAILSFTLPSYLAEFMQYSLFAFAATGGILISGVLMVFYFKQLQTAPHHAF